MYSNGNTQSLFTGLLSVPPEVATRTLPSAPGWTAIILASSHLAGGRRSSFINANSPMHMFIADLRHFGSCCNDDTYSNCHRFQISCVILRRRLQRDSWLIGVFVVSGSGTVFRASLLAASLIHFKTGVIHTRNQKLACWSYSLNWWVAHDLLTGVVSLEAKTDYAQTA